MKIPRLLLIDMTPIGGGSATGELKASFFDAETECNLLHLRQGADAEPVLTVYNRSAPINLPVEPEGAINAAVDFEPELILYRPVPDCARLHDAAMNIIRRANCPFGVWMMDDWPDQLAATSPDECRALEGDLRQLLAGSSFNLAISETMAREFGARYKCHFDVVRNGVDPADWPAAPARDHNDRRPVVMRYSGSLAPNTTRQSILEIARSVSRLRSTGLDARFEIRTQQTWVDEFNTLAAGLNCVSVATTHPTIDAYRTWLAQADIGVIAYNFDAATQRYLKYSFANKLPELLASGSAVIAYGPQSLETLKELAAVGAIELVDRQSDAQLDHSISRLVENAERRQTLGNTARNVAFEKYSLHAQRKFFEATLLQAARPPALLTASRPSRHLFEADEPLFAYHYARGGETTGLMIDVGAHHGGALKQFMKHGWRVHAFEPDAENRKHLQAIVRDADNVQVHDQAVSNTTGNLVEFYRSPLSDGISTLRPFHESHRLVNKVPTLRLSDFLEQENISEVDFLKIDVEGGEHDVLDGLNLKRNKPNIIVAEFEEAKSNAHDTGAEALARKLETHGYHVVASEWRPIEQYGGQHVWRRLLENPREAAPESWGNLIAFREPPDETQLFIAFAACLQPIASDFEINVIGPARTRAAATAPIVVWARRMVLLLASKSPGLVRGVGRLLGPARPAIRRVLRLPGAPD